MRDSFREDEEYVENKDRISKLCDDMLILILSNMEMKDAATTSMLSWRWRYLAACRTILNFSDAAQDSLHVFDRTSLKHGRPKFVRWVNQVITLNRAPCLDQFRVCFDLDESHKDDIDRWISFAVSRRVKQLELDFSWFGYRTEYRLESRILKMADLSCLRTLYLRCLSINGELLEWVLSPCDVLEKLFVEKCLDIGNLKVRTKSLRFKYLTISVCHGLDVLEIDTSNLLSFRLCQPNRNAEVIYNNVSSLREVFYGGNHGLVLSHFRPISCFSTRLIKLYLDVDLEWVRWICECKSELETAESNLKKEYNLQSMSQLLPVQVELEDDRTSTSTSTSTGNHPFLRNDEWTQQLLAAEEAAEAEYDSIVNLTTFNNLYWAMKTLEVKEEIEADSSVTLPCLRKVEWRGEIGLHGSDYLLPLYIVKHAPHLEIFSYDPCCFYDHSFGL